MIIIHTVGGNTVKVFGTKPCMNHRDALVTFGPKFGMRKDSKYYYIPQAKTGILWL